MVNNFLKIVVTLLISIATFYFLVIYETPYKKSIKYKIIRKEWSDGSFNTCRYILGNGKTFEGDCKKYDIGVDTSAVK